MDLGKNIFLFLWAILFIVPTIKAQNEDAFLLIDTIEQNHHEYYLIHKMEQYKCLDTAIEQILDSLIQLSEECIFRKIRKLYYIEIAIGKRDTASLYFRFTLSPLHSYYYHDKNKFGYYFYNGILVIITSGQSISIDDFFHSKTNSMFYLYYRYESDLTIRSDNASLVYDWDKGQFNLFSKSSCDSICYCVYKVQAEDTWMNLCDKINCNTYYWITTLYPKQPWFYTLMKLVCAINLLKMEAKNDIDKNDLWNTSTSTKIDMKKAETPDNSILFPKEKDSIYLKFFYKKGNPLRVKRIG